MAMRRILCSVLFPATLVCGVTAEAATIVVDTLADSATPDSLCSLREAIQAANTNTPFFGCVAGSGPADRILFTVAGAIVLTSDLPAITGDLAVVGPGRDLLSLDGDQQFRIFVDTAVSPSILLVRDLTLEKGFMNLSTGGGCVQAGTQTDLHLEDVTVRGCLTTGNGGGVAAYRSVHLVRAWLDGNEAQGPGGGGGLLVFGTGAASLMDSAITDNFASHTNGPGGGAKISTNGEVVLANCTISGNRTNGRGGGLSVFGVGTNSMHVLVRDSTFHANDSDLDATSALGTGGSISLVSGATAPVEFELLNSIVAGGEDHATPTSCDDIAFEVSATLTITSLGFNLIGDNTCATGPFPESPGPGVPNANGDFAGSSAAPIDPRLDILAANGGPTPTHLPLGETPHPVIDQGSCPDAERDQRGRGDPGTELRAHDVAAVPDNPQGDGCDIGSVERQATSLPPGAIFADGFESATTLFWSSEVP